MTNEEEFINYDNEIEEDDDEFDDEEEEEILVYVDFEGISESNIFCDEKLQLDMIGLDMEHPIMQINGKHYEGTYEDDVGTSLFFEKDPNPPVGDPVFDKPINIKYFGKVDKILKMKRIFVKPRLEVLGDSEHSSCIPNIKTLKDFGIPPSYQDKALKLWTEKRNERLNAMDEYLEKQKQREEKRQQGIEPDSESDDDNPFAIFKVENTNDPLIDANTSSINETNNEINLTNDSGNDNDNQQFTVIDPGPSTSKDSIPWVNPKTESNSDQNNESINHINHGHIEIVPIRVCPKRLPKKVKCTKSGEVVTEDEVQKILNRDPDDVVIDSLLANKGTSDVTIDDNDNADDNEDELNSTELSDKPEVIMEDRKTVKEKKREAKMKEITDRLKKKAADEKIYSNT
ncbi:protein PFC0760c [Microplitis demolitor]|uniref:protein PFC0760c n=1 Tax=Microplitis demolitor TaxID=69319 RepID=UPI0004400123|nr:protein PFC0760c [Microplitis demolitor]